MKIVIAPDSYKGCLSSLEVATAIEAGIKKAGSLIDTVIIPIADGGEGTVEAFVKATNGQIIKTKAHDPLMGVIDSFYGILGDQKTAVIEMASAAGLHLIPASKRNPMHTSTYGCGELMTHALDLGIRDFIIGIGGSSTNDGGLGMVTALGGKFYDKNKEDLPLGGQYLSDLESFDLSALDPRLKDCHIKVACDVKNPLYGFDGASYVYARQKGANEEEIKILDDGLKHLAKVIDNQKETVAGAGAAGGLGYGLITFLNGQLQAGIDLLIEYCQFEEQIQNADLLLTGEGQTDGQTAFGKAPVGLAKVAKKYQVPVICISGSLGKNYEEIYKYGIDGAFSISPGVLSLEQAMKDASINIENFSHSLIRSILPYHK